MSDAFQTLDGNLALGKYSELFQCFYVPLILINPCYDYPPFVFYALGKYKGIVIK